MKAFILVGGLGTRLRKIGITQPKPMILINKRPFLEYLILSLKQFGIREIVLCVGYGAEVVQNYFGTGQKSGVQIYYSREENPLGTGGAIRNAHAFADEENLILNGDSFLELDYHQLIAYHHEKKAQVTIATITIPTIQDYGNIQTDEEGRILSFAEKIPGEKGLINGGIYLFQKKALDFIAEDRPVSIEKETFPILVSTGQCFAFKADGYFLDIGTPDRLERARIELPEVFKNLTQKNQPISDKEIV